MSLVHYCCCYKQRCLIREIIFDQREIRAVLTWLGLMWLLWIYRLLGATNVGRWKKYNIILHINYHTRRTWFLWPVFVWFSPPRRKHELWRSASAWLWDGGLFKLQPLFNWWVNRYSIHFFTSVSSILFHPISIYILCSPPPPQYL